MNMPHTNTSPFARPYVVSWNLTYRCNLACEHCYLDAGGTPLVGTENFADRSELGTEECFRVIDDIAAFAPECVTIPSEVARGVVARSVAALSKGPNRLLGYVENMSGYYCRDCNAIKPLFVSPESSGLSIPCLGTVPFDPELARLCDTGIPLAELPDTPVGRALEHVAQQLLDSLESTTPASAHASRELRPGREHPR